MLSSIVSDDLSLCIFVIFTIILSLSHTRRARPAAGSLPPATPKTQHNTCRLTWAFCCNFRNQIPNERTSSSRYTRSSSPSAIVSRIYLLVRRPAACLLATRVPPVSSALACCLRLWRGQVEAKMRRRGALPDQRFGAFFHVGWTTRRSFGSAPVGHGPHIPANPFPVQVSIGATAPWYT